MQLAVSSRLLEILSLSLSLSIDRSTATSLLAVWQIGVNSLCTYGYDRYKMACVLLLLLCMHLCSCNLMFLTVLLPVVVFIVSSAGTPYYTVSHETDSLFDLSFSLSAYRVRPGT